MFRALDSGKDLKKNMLGNAQTHATQQRGISRWAPISVTGHDMSHQISQMDSSMTSKMRFGVYVYVCARSAHVSCLRARACTCAVRACSCFNDRSWLWRH